MFNNNQFSKGRKVLLKKHFFESFKTQSLIPGAMKDPESQNIKVAKKKCNNLDCSDFNQNQKNMSDEELKNILKDDLNWLIILADNSRSQITKAVEDPFAEKEKRNHYEVLQEKYEKVNQISQTIMIPNPELKKLQEEKVKLQVISKPRVLYLNESSIIEQQTIKVKKIRLQTGNYISTGDEKSDKAILKNLILKEAKTVLTKTEYQSWLNDFEYFYNFDE